PDLLPLPYASSQFSDLKICPSLSPKSPFNPRAKSDRPFMSGKPPAARAAHRAQAPSQAIVAATSAHRRRLAAAARSPASEHPQVPRPAGSRTSEALSVSVRPPRPAALHWAETSRPKSARNRARTDKVPRVHVATEAPNFRSDPPRVLKIGGPLIPHIHVDACVCTSINGEKWGAKIESVEEKFISHEQLIK
ncbi:ubiquitin-conjugating enzyme 3, partial [Striga asiatica]